MNIHTGIAVAIGVLVIMLFFVFGFGGFNFSPSVSSNSPTSPTGSTSLGSNIPTALNAVDVTDLQGLSIQDFTIGTGAEALLGKQISVHYVGMLENGTVFDSSIPRGEPLPFTLGAGQVIQGWDQGFAGMKEGGRRVLIIPPSLGYGANQIGPIPPNSTLIFEVELMKVGQ